MEVQDGSKKAIVAAFIANMGIAAAKFTGFLLTGSAGLAAEAVHSAADSGNQGLLLLGSRRSVKGADAEHPFGHARERYFWAFIVALVLFSMGGLFAIYEGIQKLIHPHETENLMVAVVILGIAIVLESFSLRTAVIESRHFKPPTMSWMRFIRTAKSPELPVVLLEDVAAETGLIIALAGVLAGHYTHNARWDAMGSVAIGILLVVVAVILAVEMKSLLIGESASTSDRDALTTALADSSDVRRVIYMFTEHLGPDTILVGTKVEFDHGLSVAQLSLAIDAAEERMRAVVPHAQYIFIEPDIAYT